MLVSLLLTFWCSSFSLESKKSGKGHKLHEKNILLLLLVCALACTAGCGKSADSHDAQSTANNSVSLNSSGTAPTADASASENPSSAGYPQNPSADYPYDIAADRKTFDAIVD